ncbi:hypothetical protein [Candidatus Nitrospira bockiana]
MLKPRHFPTLSVVLLSTVLVVPVTVWAGGEKEGQAPGHRQVSGQVISERSGLLMVKTPDGSTFTLNPNAAKRHGHEVPKVGDELVLLVDENNTVIEAHPKGEGSAHQFVTGKLMYVGKTKKEIRLATPEGEKVFPIERLEIKTGGIEEGAIVTAEVNEAGTIIDLHRAGSSSDRP